MTKTIAFGDVQVSWPGFGAMGFSHHRGTISTDAEAFAVLERALELGCTFWDTAVVYGYGANEELIGRFFAAHPGSREKVFLASKCGLAVDVEKREDLKKTTNRRDHILEYIEGSIQRLGTTPDLYYLHRMDESTPLEESIGTMAEIKKAGKCKYIGLSEMSAETLRKACAISHIDCVQIEYSPWCLNHERNGVIEACHELGVAIVAYSPLGRGVLTGQFRDKAAFQGPNDNRGTIPKYGEFLDQNLKLVDELTAIAGRLGVSPGQLSLAWVGAQGAIPIPGTKQISRLEENWASNRIDLTEADLKEIREVIERCEPVGARYDGESMKRIGK